MPAPLALIGLGGVLSAFGSFLIRMLGRILTGTILQGILGTVIFLGLSYYATTELGIGEYVIEKATEILTDSGLIGSSYGYNFELGSIISALRIVDCLLVIINGYFAGLTVNLLKRAVSLSRST